MKTRHTLVPGLCVLAALLFLGTACSRKDVPSTPGTPSTPTVPAPADPGFVSIVVHDAPPDPKVAKLIVSIRAIRVRAATTGAWTDLPADPHSFDLLSLQDGRVVELLSNELLRPDEYGEMRLRLRAEPLAILADGQQVPVHAPSAITSGYKVKGAFTISPGHCTRVSVDFDASKSLKPNKAHGFILEPVIWIDQTQAVPCAKAVALAVQPNKTLRQVLNLLPQSIFLRGFAVVEEPDRVLTFSTPTSTRDADVLVREYGIARLENFALMKKLLATGSSNDMKLQREIQRLSELEGRQPSADAIVVSVVYLTGPYDEIAGLRNILFQGKMP